MLAKYKRTLSNQFLSQPLSKVLRSFLVSFLARFLPSLLASFLGSPVIPTCSDAGIRGDARNRWSPLADLVEREHSVANIREGDKSVGLPTLPLQENFRVAIKISAQSSTTDVTIQAPAGSQT
jgi:hypothetical protein